MWGKIYASEISMGPHSSENLSFEIKTNSILTITVPGVNIKIYRKTFPTLSL